MNFEVSKSPLGGFAQGGSELPAGMIAVIPSRADGEGPRNRMGAFDSPRRDPRGEGVERNGFYFE